MKWNNLATHVFVFLAFLAHHHLDIPRLNAHQESESYFQKYAGTSDSISAELIQQVASLENDHLRYVCFNETNPVLNEDGAEDLRLIAVASEQDENAHIEIHYVDNSVAMSRAIKLQQMIELFGVAGQRISIIKDRDFKYAADTVFMLNLITLKQDLSFEH